MRKLERIVHSLARCIRRGKRQQKQMNVIPLRPRQTGKEGSAQKPAPASGVRPPAMPYRSPEDYEDRRRMLQNVAAVALVACLLLLGGWLIDRLQTYSRLQACLDFGHRHCTTLKVEPPAGR